MSLAPKPSDTSVSHPRGFVVNSTTAEFTELLKQCVAEETQTHD